MWSSIRSEIPFLRLASTIRISWTDGQGNPGGNPGTDRMLLEICGQDLWSDGTGTLAKQRLLTTKPKVTLSSICDDHFVWASFL